MITYPCPHCGERLTIDPGKAGKAHVCSHCGQSSLVPAATGTVAAQKVEQVVSFGQDRQAVSRPISTSQSGGRVGTSFAWGLCIPIVGLIRGLMKAFDPDPEEKRLAGASFGGTVGGCVLAYFLATAVLPGLAAGPGGPAYNRGVEAMKEERWTAAVMEFRAAAKHSPSFAAAWLNLSLSLYRTGDEYGAEDAARRSVALVDSGKNRGVPDDMTERDLTGRCHGYLALILYCRDDMAGFGNHAVKSLADDPSGPIAPALRETLRPLPGEAVATP